MFQIRANSKKGSFCYAVQLICKILDHVTDIVPIKTCVHAVPSTIFSLFEYNMQREIKTCSHFKDVINFGCAIRNLFRKKQTKKQDGFAEKMRSTLSPHQSRITVKRDFFSSTGEDFAITQFEFTRHMKELHSGQITCIQIPKATFHQRISVFTLHFSRTVNQIIELEGGRRVGFCRI